MRSLLRVLCLVAITLGDGSCALLTSSAARGVDNAANRQSVPPVIRHRTPYTGATDPALCSVSRSASEIHSADQPRDSRMIDTYYSRHMSAVLPDMRPLVNFTGTLGMYEIFIVNLKDRPVQSLDRNKFLEQHLNEMWKPQIEKANYSTSSVRVVITDCVENYWFTSTGDALISIVFALTLDDSILNRTINGTMLPAIEPLSLDQMKDKTDGQIANVHIGPVFRGYTLIIRNANVSWLFSLESSEYNTSKVLAPVRDYLLAFLRSSSCTSSRDNGGASAQQIDIQFGYPYPAVVRDMKASRYYQLYGNDIAVAFVITVNNKTYQGPFPFKTINGNGLAGVKLIFAHGDQYRIDPIPTLFWAYLMGSQFATPRYWTPTADYIKKALQQPLNDSTADALRASKISFSVNALMMEPPPYCTDTIQLAVSLHAETSNPNGAFLLNAALPLFAGIQRILYGSQLRDEINHQLVSSIVPRKRLYTDAEMLDLDRCKNADFYTCPNSKRSLVVSVVPINTDHFVVSKDICANEYQRYKFLNAVVYAFNKVNTVVINDAILNVTLTTCTDGLLTSRMYEAVRLEFGLFLEEPKLSWSIFEMPTDAELDAAFYPIRFKVARDPIIDTSSYYDSLNSTLTKG